MTTERTSFEIEAAKVCGIATDRHALLMHGLCRWLNVRHAVEVGPFQGKCSVWIARAIQENGGGLLTCIDDFSLGDSEAVLRANLAACGVEDTVSVLRADSQKLDAFPYCEFAFIDGDHSYDGCLSDVNKAIAAGARCIVLHDTVSWWGPRSLVDWFIEDEKLVGLSPVPPDDERSPWQVIEANHDEGLAVFVRREPKPGARFTRETHPLGRV